jgi:hypothetical protein
MHGKRTRERRHYDLASIQIKCMVELAQHVQPDVAFYAKPSSDEVNILNGNIHILREWLDELAGLSRCDPS